MKGDQEMDIDIGWKWGMVNVSVCVREGELVSMLAMSAGVPLRGSRA